MHAFEPNPDAVERLRRNIVLNDVTNISLHPVGVGAKTGEEQLYASSYVEMGNATFLKPSNSAQEFRSAPVKIETLDSCFGQKKTGGELVLSKLMYKAMNAMFFVVLLLSSSGTGRVSCLNIKMKISLPMMRQRTPNSGSRNFSKITTTPSCTKLATTHL